MHLLWQLSVGTPKATAAWDRHPDKAKCPKCSGKHRKKDCVKTSLGKQVKELISERAHLGDTYLEKIAGILQEKLTACARQADSEGSSSRVFVAGRG